MYYTKLNNNCIERLKVNTMTNKDDKNKGKSGPTPMFPKTLLCGMRTWENQ